MKEDPEGLTSSEAESRLDEYGSNELEEDNKTTKMDVLLRQFSNLLIWILIGAAVVSFFAGKTLTFYFVVLIIGIIAVMGFLQEWKAEQAMEKLEEMTEPVVEVYRDGKITEIPSKEVVPGDTLKLEMGDKIPADAEVMSSNELKIDEAILTGESEAVKKEEGDEIYSGTTIVHGRAIAEVTETGMTTELGKIADEIQQEDEDTPLQRRIDSMSKKLAITALTVCSGIFALGVMQGAPVDQVLVVALALIVATVPEALPLTLTLTLSLGMRDMARKNAIVNRMLAVEGLGSTTVICSDKTGTLTKNEMTVKKLYVDGEEYSVEGTGYVPEGDIRQNGRHIEAKGHGEIDKLYNSAVLCNNSELILEEGNYTIQGEPTEAALTVMGEKEGYSRENLEESHPRAEEILFTSERKMMTTVHETGGSHTAYSKGAPEVLLDKCDRILIEGQEKELTEERKQDILDKNEDMAEEALRVLGFTYREGVEEPFNPENTETEMVFVGLAGMIDPPRENIKEAIETCEGAGIDVKMVTGDNPMTAKAIAREIELTDEDPTVLTGKEIEEMEEDELHRKVPDVDIYARTHPEHKLHIIEALKDDGEIVAMTGDGVNDAPAVKKADVGIGMGQKGTDVTKESSDMILQDDNFNSIVTAIEDGRKIYDNIEKFTTYLLSRNFTEIILIALGIIFLGFEYLPLIALQILFINVIGEEMPAISLGLDPATDGIMERDPRDPDRKLLNPRNGFLVVTMALFMALTAFGVFLLGNPTSDLEVARTMAFSSLVLMVMVHSFNFRSLSESVLDLNPLENKWILISIALVFPLMMMTIYYDPVSAAFEHIGLNAEQWGIAGVGAAGTLVFIEIVKKLANKWF